MNSIHSIDTSNTQTGNHAPDTSPPRRVFFPLDTPNHYVFKTDNSTLERFVTCARSAGYYIVNRREPHNKTALAFGSLIHEGLEAYYRCPVPDPGERLHCAREAMARSFAKNPYPVDDYRSPDFANDVLYRYSRKYKHDQFEVLRDTNGDLLVERSFQMQLYTLPDPLTCKFPTHNFIDVDDPTHPDWVRQLDPNAPFQIDHLTVVWTGKIDVVTNFANGVWVTDHKTSSFGGPQYFAEFDLSQPATGYCLALRNLTNLEPSGLIINALFCRKPSPTGQGTTFDRRTFHYRDWQYTEWTSDIYYYVTSFLGCLQTGYFPKGTKWCLGKYGKCAYHSICTAAPSARPSLLASPDFSNVTWDPTVNNA